MKHLIMILITLLLISCGKEDGTIQDTRIRVEQRPCLVTNLKIEILCYYQVGTNILHREDGPAIEFTYTNGSRYQDWYLHGLKGRLKGPARTVRYISGNVYEAYFISGELHRDGGPAQTEYDEDELVVWEIYRSHGKIHREYGPAIIEYDDEGNITFEAYYLDGVLQ